MSSIKVYPYITNSLPAADTGSAATARANEQENPMGFHEIFANANRTQRAMAVDALIAASETKSVDPETVQRLLGFNPAPAAIVANNKMTYTNSWHTSDSAAVSQTENRAADPTSVQSSHIPNTADVSSEYMEACFAEAAQTYGIDIDLLKAVAQTESDFDPNCTSSAGAMGIMQLMPGTAADLGVTNAYDVHDNILGGARYLSQLMQKYDGDLSLTLAAYNAGSGTVKKYGGVPPFTEGYIQKVMNYYNKEA